MTDSISVKETKVLVLGNDYFLKQLNIMHVIL